MATPLSYQARVSTSRKDKNVPLAYQIRISGLGAKIRSEREKLGLSSTELSKILHTATEWIWQVETGYRTVGLHHVPILESALKTTLVDRQSLIENILSIAGKTP
jgi:ribosome-binding protein aMBF1 (putative translation factor)